MTRLPRTTRLALAIVTVLTTAPVGGCGTSADLGPLRASPERLPHAVAVRDCAPWDGPAVTIYLSAASADSTPPPPPHLQLSLWRSATELERNTFAWPAETQEAAATWCETDDACRAAPTGRVRIRRVWPDSLIEGEFDLQFDGRISVGGGFRAVWLETRIMCG